MVYLFGVAFVAQLIVIKLAIGDIVEAVNYLLYILLSCRETIMFPPYVYDKYKNIMKYRIYDYLFGIKCSGLLFVKSYYVLKMLYYFNRSNI